MNGLARKLEIHRHRNEAGAHDAVIGGDIFGAVGGKQRDPVAALQAALDERARDAVRHGVELRERELARAVFAAEIDDRDFCQIAIAPDQIAEIGKTRHALTPASAAP